MTNNEIKDIMKVIKSLDNRTISLRGTTRKITSQEGGFLNLSVLKQTHIFSLAEITKYWGSMVKP